MIEVRWRRSLRWMRWTGRARLMLATVGGCAVLGDSEVSLCDYRIPPDAFEASRQLMNYFGYCGRCLAKARSLGYSIDMWSRR